MFPDGIVKGLDGGPDLQQRTLRGRSHPVCFVVGLNPASSLSSTLPATTERSTGIPILHNESQGLPHSLTSEPP